jgi:RNA polymerase sigma-70 factor (sigma-E family)
MPFTVRRSGASLHVLRHLSERRPNEWEHQVGQCISRVGRWNVLGARKGLGVDDQRENDARADMDLLKKSRARDEFEGFATAHADGLLRAAYLMVGDRVEAEDIVQECLLRVARKWPRVRAMEHPGAYARTVMLSLVIDGGAKRSRRTMELVAIETQAARGDGDATVASIDARTDLIRALAELPARQRAVLVLRYFADLPEVEIATALGCSAGTVKSSASRALERLRQGLDPATTSPDIGPSTETDRKTMP